MKKRDLLDFIDKVEIKAIRSVEKRWDKVIKEKKDQLLSKYKDSIQMYQNTFSNLSANIRNILCDMKDDNEVGYVGGYYGIESTLSNLEGNKLFLRIAEKCTFIGEVQKLYDLRNKEIEEVKANYLKVKAVSQNMRETKKIAEYLKELGFDISSVEDEQVTALVADIDKSKLFVCGENK